MQTALGVCLIALHKHSLNFKIIPTSCASAIDVHQTQSSLFQQVPMNGDRKEDVNGLRI